MNLTKHQRNSVQHAVNSIALDYFAYRTGDGDNTLDHDVDVVFFALGYALDLPLGDTVTRRLAKQAIIRDAELALDVGATWQVYSSVVQPILIEVWRDILGPDGRYLDADEQPIS